MRPTKEGCQEVMHMHIHKNVVQNTFSSTPYVSDENNLSIVCATITGGIKLPFCAKRKAIRTEIPTVAIMWSAGAVGAFGPP
mmetsp:Transcript_49822/g.82713  ORF Transcript_49822/g.82713 Transcript_49822/m.82713 type:complete len:82 (-) Transcript_49822:1237-1482(-)